MLDAFKAGGDFHSRTAMNMYQHIRDAVHEKKVLEWHPQPNQEKPPVPLLKVLLVLLVLFTALAFLSYFLFVLTAYIHILYLRWNYNPLVLVVCSSFNQIPTKFFKMIHRYMYIILVILGLVNF